MAWNRLNYEVPVYEDNLKASLGGGAYMLGTPFIKDHSPPNSEECKATQCFSFYPGKRSVGISVKKGADLVEVEAALRGTDIPRTKNQDVIKKARDSAAFNSTELEHFGDCGFSSEETRTSNPPANLRGTGWNRWENLNRDPQLPTLDRPVPVQNRIVVKDNHRPCYPDLLNQTEAWPVADKSKPCDDIKDVCGVPTESLHPYSK